jgi:O-antigen/teichoic acid export membrane protein
MAIVSLVAGSIGGLVYALLPASTILAPLLRPLVGAGIIVALLFLGLANAVLLAERRPAAILAGSLAAGLVKCVAIVLVLDAAGAIAAYAAGAIAGLALAASVAARGLPARSEARDGVELPLRGYALANWVSGAASLLPLALAPSLLLTRSGAETAAYAAIPLLLLTFLTLPPAVVARTLFAEASRHPERTGALTRRGLLLAFAGSSAALLGSVIAGPLVLSVFGADYAAEGSELLLLLAVASLIAVPNYFIDAVLNVRRDTTGYAVVNVAGSGAVALAVLLLTYDLVSLGTAWIAGQAAYLAIAGATLLYRRRFPHA